VDKIDELYYEGHLRKVEASPLKSALSLKEAKIWLKEAEETFKVGFYRSSQSRILSFFTCFNLFCCSARC